MHGFELPANRRVTDDNRNSSRGTRDRRRCRERSGEVFVVLAGQTALRRRPRSMLKRSEFADVCSIPQLLKVFRPSKLEVEDGQVVERIQVRRVGNDQRWSPRSQQPLVDERVTVI